MATHDKDDVLAFSDKILVLDNGKIINQGSPKKLYNIPGNIKTAAFFRNLIVLNQTIIKHLILKAVAVKLFAIPIRLFLIIVQKVRLFVIDNFFKGSHYIVKANFKGKVIRFNHFKPLKKNLK